MRLQIWKLHDIVTNINRLVLCQLKNVNINLVIKKIKNKNKKLVLGPSVIILWLYNVL